MSILRKLGAPAAIVAVLIAGAATPTRCSPEARAAFRHFLAEHAYDAPVVSSLYSDATWWRVAVCETGGDVHMHGSVYSSAFGVLNEAVREEADDDASASRILAGSASYDEQLRMAKREANRYGITAWAWGTLRCAGIA